MTELPQPQHQQHMQAVFLSTSTASRQPLPKQLTAAIKSCASLDRLAQLFYAHQAVLNPIHIAAMLTKLPKLDTSMHTAAAAPGADLPWILSAASAQQVKLQQLLQQLLARLKIQGCSEYSPRGVANIVWALAKLQYAPDPELRQMLLEKFCSELASAVPQDVSNVLWGVAKLTKERTAALTNSTPLVCSAMGAMQPMGLTGGSYPSPSSSNSPSLGGSGLGLQEWGLAPVAPPGAMDGPSSAATATPLLAQDQVRLLLQHLCQQLQIASVQTISNSLWAVVVLQQEHQWCMCNCLSEVQALLSVFCKQPQQALPGHIQPVIRCMAQLATTCSNHAGDRWIKWQSPLLQQLLDYLCSQREHMEMHHVSSVLRDVAQIVCLHLLLSKQKRDAEQKTEQQHFEGNLVESGNDSCPVAASTACIGSALQPTADADNRTGLTAGSAVPSLNTITAEQEAEDVLARLAATGGPQDASSTVVALGMLQPQLEQLGLKRGVAGLCSLLPAGALPHLGEEIGQRLLAAASPLEDLPSSAAPSTIDSSHLQYMNAQHGKLPPGDPCVQQVAQPPMALQTPAARPASSSGTGNSSSSSSSSSNVDNPTLTPAAATAAGNVSSGVVVVYNPGLPVAAGSPAASEGFELAGQSAEEATLVGAAHAVEQLAASLTGTADADPAATALDAVNPAESQSASVLDTPLHSGCLSPAVTSAEALDFRIATGEAADDIRTTAADDSQEEAAARQLTHNIAYADSVYQLAEIFDAHSSVMDMIHITACITRLSKVLGTAPSPPVQRAATALLPLVGAKLLQVLPHANARGIANVLWGYGRLKTIPQSDLIARLVEAFTAKLPTAACRDSAVVLWSLARLTESQGMAHISVQPELLQRLGTAVMQQLSTAAVGAGAGQPLMPAAVSQQRSGALTRSSSARSDIGSSAGGTEPNLEASHAVSSRDVSNSLMALTRLGFRPERTEETLMTAATGQSAAEHSTPAANSIAVQLDILSLDPQASAAASAGEPQVLQSQQQRQMMPPATITASPAALTLPVKAIETVVDFLLQHAASAKTLDLQEAATALKQMGLLHLQSRVTAAITALPLASSSSLAHHGLQYSQGSASSLHQQGRGSSTASPVQSRLHLAGTSSPAGGFTSRSSRPFSSSAVSVPGTINLSGTQLAGLLQQQRRQQPLPISGPAYGAGWLGPAASSGPGVTQQRQQRFSGGRSGGSLAGNMLLRSGGGAAGQGFGGTAVPGAGMLGGYGPAGYSSNQPGLGASMHQQQQSHMQQQLFNSQSMMQQQQQMHGMLAQQQARGVLGSAPAQYTYGHPLPHGGVMLPQRTQQQQHHLSGIPGVNTAGQIQQALQLDRQLSASSAGSNFLNFSAPGSAALGGMPAQNAALAAAAGGLAAAGLPWIGQGDLPVGCSALHLQQQHQQRQGMMLGSALHGNFAGGPANTAQASGFDTSSGLILPQSFANIDPALAAATGISAFATGSEQLQPYNALSGANPLQLPQPPPGLGGQAMDAAYLLQQQQQQVPASYTGGVMVNPLTGFLPGNQF